MIGQKVFDITACLDAEFVVDAGAVNIFRQSSGVVVDQDILSVVGEFCVLSNAGRVPPNPSTEGVVFVAGFFFSRGGFGEAVLAVPCVTPKVVRLGFLHHVPVRVVLHRRSIGRDQLVELAGGVAVGGGKMAPCAVADRIIVVELGLGPAHRDVLEVSNVDDSCPFCVPSDNQPLQIELDQGLARGK